jgi:amino acid permease
MDSSTKAKHRIKDTTQSTKSNHTTTISSSNQSMGFLDFSQDGEDNDIEASANRNSSAIHHEPDADTLRKLGKKQLMNRKFGFISMVGFTSTMMATWEAEGFVIQGGLLNGGPVALVYGFILCFLGTLSTSTSIAELSSMFPTAGGQYHFVALLAPARWRCFASWMAGKFQFRFLMNTLTPDRLDEYSCMASYNSKLCISRSNINTRHDNT